MRAVEFLTSHRAQDLTEDQIFRIFESMVNPDVLLEDINPQAAQQVKQAANTTLQRLMNLPPAQVEGFDEKLNQLQAQIAKKPLKSQHKTAIEAFINGYKRFARRWPLTQAVILAALGVVATLSGGAITGAIAVGFLKTVNDLILGKKAKQAVLGGVKSGILAWGLGEIIQMGLNSELVQSAMHWAGEGAEELAHSALHGVGDVVTDVAREPANAHAVAKVAMKNMFRSHG